MNALRQVLTVGLDARVAASVRQALMPVNPVLRVVPDIGSATLVAASCPFDALLVSHPLPGTPALLRAVRGPSSPCRRAGLVLLADSRRNEAEAFLGHGANRVLATDEVERRLVVELDRLFRVAPRVAVKAATRVYVTTSGFVRRFLCETVNASATGLLLRAGNSFPAGTEVAFEILPPWGGEAIGGRGYVVRSTQQGREPYPGIALAVLESEQRYASFLEHAGRR